jgi:hypothetical protein
LLSINSNFASVNFSFNNGAINAPLLGGVNRLLCFSFIRLPDGFILIYDVISTLLSLGILLIMQA